MFAENSIFCDLGCGNGQIVEEMKLYAKKSIGIEKKKTLNDDVITGDFIKNIPHADVYYMWVGRPAVIFEKIRDKIKGILLVGAHTQRETSFLERRCCYIEEFEDFQIGVIFCFKENKCTSNQK